MVNYHKQGIGRPQVNKSKANPLNISASQSRRSEPARRAAPIKPTHELLLKKALLLRGSDGSTDCPIDVLAAQRIITPEQAEAARLYKITWSSAYGKRNKVAAGGLVDVIDGFGDTYNDFDQTIESLNNKRDRFHRIDSVVNSFGPETRKCLRHLCEGFMPHYLRGAIWALSKHYHLDVKLEEIENKLKELNSTTGKKNFKESQDLAFQKRQILKKISSIQDGIKEPAFDIYMRAQLRLALNALVQEFRIN